MSEEIQTELEALKAQLEERDNAIESLTKKNRQLLGEVKVNKAKAKGLEIDPEEHAALQTKVEELEATYSKSQKMSQIEIDRLTKELSQKDSSIQNYLVDNGLNDAMLKANVRPEMQTAVKAMLRQNVSIQNEGGELQALMGEKPLFEAVSEWAQSDAGKPFVIAPDNSGGGAAGGAANNSGPTPKGNLGGSKEQRINALKNRFPELN